MMNSDFSQQLPVLMTLAGSSAPDISRFVHVRSADNPALSPEGTHLAFRTTMTGSPQLWVVESSGGWPTQLTFVESVTFHAWSPAGDWLIYGADQGGNEREAYYLINQDGTIERELLAPSEAFRVFGGFSWDGQHFAYATTERNGQDFDIHVVHLASGKDRVVYWGKMGLYPVSWRPDGKVLILSEARGEDANDVYLLDISSGTLQTLFKPDEASFYDSFAWDPDSNGFYLATNEGREFSALAYYDVGKKALRILESPPGEVEQVKLAANGQYLAWTVNQEGFSRLCVRNLRTGSDVAIPLLPMGTYAVCWAQRAPVLAVFISGPQLPGDVWTWNLKSGETYRATQSSCAGLNMSKMILPAHYSFRARDGIALHGHLYMPPSGVKGSRFPVLLSLHGGPTAQARPSFKGPLQHLLTCGIAIFDFNYRGSTGYGKTFARLNDRRLRENELCDLSDAVEWLGRQSGIDGSRIAIMGESYGGYLTLAALTRLPDLFSGGVAWVGVTNWLTALEGASPQLRASDLVEYGNINDPEDRAFFTKISPLTYVHQMRAPALVIHGANDPRNPASESDQFVRLVRKNGGKIDYLRFPDEGHSIRKLSNQIIAYRRIAAFLESTLGVLGSTSL